MGKGEFIGNRRREGYDIYYIDITNGRVDSAHSFGAPLNECDKAVLYYEIQQNMIYLDL